MSEQRSLRIEQVPATTLVRIAWNGGGELPEELKGHYTTPAEAKKAIQNWEAKSKRGVDVEVKRPDDEAPKRGRPAKAIGV